MKRVLVWGPALAILAIALASACSKAAEGARGSGAQPAILKAASASAAETGLAGCGAKWIDANVRDQPASVHRHSQLLQADDTRS